MVREGGDESTSGGSESPVFVADGRENRGFSVLPLAH
jgi:hypothetical protein